jgi:Fe-S-cluster containining protein
MRPCEGCAGECCKHYVVGLSGHDVWTIATQLHLAPGQFVTIAQEHEATGIGFKLDATKMTFSLVLAKRPGSDGRQQCTFLLELPDGTGRCGIYPLRPSACRVYPAQLRDGDVVFRDGIVCPKGAWNVPSDDLPAWRTSLLRSQMEWAVYATVVHHWNEQAVLTPRAEMRTPDDYYVYLLDRYERVHALERELPSSEMHALVDGWGEHAGTPAGETRWERFLTSVEQTIA